ncbi:MAG: RIP metalloprotease RseP [bacterium]
MTIIIAILSIVGLLVLHEFGHFIIAKKFGVKVEEFGVGLPPRILGKKFGETLYSLNLVPLGAFVRLYGEENQEKKELWSFVQKPIWQRSLIILGGVVSFWIVAVILLSIVAGTGAAVSISDDKGGVLKNPKVQVLAVAPNSPAEEAGIKPGDTIASLQLKIENEKLKIDKVKEVQDFTDKYKGQELTAFIERGKETFTVSLTPRVSPPEGEGAMGVALARTAVVSYPLWQAPIKGIEATANLTVAIVLGWGKVLASLVQGEGIPKGVQFVGPIGIGSLAAQAAKVGVNYFLQFIALISVYLAIFNILPIPALDGGKLLFLAIEKVKGKPVNQKIEQRLSFAVFVFLIGIMIFVTIKDIIRLF